MSDEQPSFETLYRAKYGRAPFEGVPASTPQRTTPRVMRDPSKPSTKYMAHALHRLKERYKVSWTGSDVESMAHEIEAGRAFRIRRRPYSHRDIWRVTYHMLTMRVVYDKREKAIVTFLPIARFTGIDLTEIAGYGDTLEPWWQGPKTKPVDSAPPKRHDDQVLEVDTKQTSKGETIMNEVATPAKTGFFKKAEKRQGKLRIAITGPSGSGKTYSALLIAKGIGGRIALVDTENKSASDYAGEFDFETIALEPDYTVTKYLAAFKAAVAEGFDVIIFDSISPEWAGKGGLLSRKEDLDGRGGNQFTNWAPITKLHEEFKSMLLGSDIHLIATMRSKQDYVVEPAGKDGKMAPRKVGLAPIQREGMEYEFTLVLDLAMNHTAACSKDRTGVFQDQIFKPTVETGKQLLAWRMEGGERTNAINAVSEPEAPMAPQPVSRRAPVQSASAALPGTNAPAGPDLVKEVMAACKAKKTLLSKEFLARNWNGTCTEQMAHQIIKDLKAA